MAAVGVFVVFAVVSMWALTTGSDCGCFGAETWPGWALAVDLACLGALALVRPPRHRVQLKDCWKKLAAAACVAAFLSMITHAVGQRSLATRGGIPAVFGANLTGEPWPTAIDDDAFVEMPDNAWSIYVFLHQDCEHCRRLAEHLSGAPWIVGNSVPVVGVVVESGKWTVMPGVVSSDPLRVRGAREISWPAGTDPFVSTPVIFVVDGGIVSHVLDGDSDLAALQSEHSLEWLRHSHAP